MACIFRLILLFMLFISKSAFANQPPIYSYYFDDTRYTSLTAACSAYPAYQNAQGFTYQTDFQYVSDAPPTSCNLSYLNSAGSTPVRSTSPFGLNKSASCPAGSSVASYGTDGLISSCTGEPPNNCVAGEGPTGYLATSSCLDGCTHAWSGQRAKIGDTDYGMYLGKTGGTCSTANGNPLMNKGDVDAAMKAADDKAVADAAAAKAASDAKNAADKAAAAAAAADAKAKSDKAASDKAASDKAEADAKAAADKAAADAADDTKTPEQKAASAGASAAATAAATAAKAAADAAQAAASAATGAAASAALPDAPPEFCSLHPTSIICKNSSVNAGSCSGGHSSGFSCSGDAIQCQIAKEQQEANCKFYEKDDALKQAYDDLKSDTNNDVGTPSNPNIINLPTSLNASGGSFSASCFEDVSASFNGTEINVPISKYCPYFEALGYLFLAISYLLAARILGGSV